MKLTLHRRPASRTFTRRAGRRSTNRAATVGFDLLPGCQAGRIGYFEPMQAGNPLELEQDCAATQIPAGNQVVLPAGTGVEIVQQLGGSLTVRALDGLFQIPRREAEALGLVPAGEAEAKPDSPMAAVGEETVWETLKECYDPEIPVNIVDLGLVYGVSLSEAPAGGRHVAVKMTLTAPGCGMGPMIAQEVQGRLLGLPGVADASVELVWDPPWHQSMITPAGRKRLGLE